MKKTVVVFIILLSVALSLYIHSAINEKEASPLTGEIKTEKKAETVPVGNPSGVINGPLIPAKEIAEIVNVGKETGKPTEEIIHKISPVLSSDVKLESVPSGQVIKEKGEKQTTLIAEATLPGISQKGEANFIKTEPVRSEVKEDPEPTEKTPGRIEKIAGTIPSGAEITIPAGTPAVVLAGSQPPAEKQGTKLPIEQIEIAEVTDGEGPRVVEQETETVPSGGLIIIPAVTPAPTLLELSTMGTKEATDAVPSETAKETPSIKTEAAVKEGTPGKAAEAKEAVPASGKKEEFIEKPDHFPGGMSTKGDNHRIAIFPFENFSDNKEAFEHVLPLLIDKLEKKGFTVVDEDSLNSFLCKDRVRSNGYVSRELAGKIREKFNVSIILTGAIISFSGEDVPEFGILARMINAADGSIPWADYYAATGEDFLSVLELGRLKSVYSLIPKVIDTLFASLKVDELYKEAMPLNRIAVMPFKNNSGFNNAGTIATYMFTVELLKSKEFVPIEYGDIRDVVIRLGIRRKGDIDYGNIDAFSKALKARGILVGVVDNYSDGAAGSAAPNVGITARLIDGSNNKVLWYNSSQSSGEEDIIALDWGRIRSVHSVAYKAVSGLVKEMSRKKWRD